MKKSIWIFLFAVLLPGFVLGWLALRSAEEQQIIFERRTAELYQKETEGLAASARDVVEAERRSFGDAVHRLLARSDAQALARDFTNSLMDAWPRKAVGFVLGKDGEMLSPTTTMAAKNADLRDFLWNNGSFLCSTQPAVVYPVPIETNTKSFSYNQVGKSRAGNVQDGKPALSVSNGPDPTILAQKGLAQQQQAQPSHYTKVPIQVEDKAKAETLQRKETTTGQQQMRVATEPQKPADSFSEASQLRFGTASPKTAPIVPDADRADLAKRLEMAKIQAGIAGAAASASQDPAPDAPTATPAPAAAAPPPLPAPAPAPMPTSPAAPALAPATPVANAPSEAVELAVSNVQAPNAGLAPIPAVTLNRGMNEQQVDEKRKERPAKLALPLSPTAAPAPRRAVTEAAKKQTTLAEETVPQILNPEPAAAAGGATGAKQMEATDAVAATTASETQQTVASLADRQQQVALGVKDAKDESKDRLSLDGGAVEASKPSGGAALIGRAQTRGRSVAPEMEGIGDTKQAVSNTDPAGATQNDAIANSTQAQQALYSRLNQDALNRMVEPQQQVRAASNWSAILPSTADFRALTAESDEGMLARFVQDKLDIVFWIRPPEAPEMVFGCLIDAGDLNQLWKDVFASRSAESPSERPPFVLALLNDKAKPVATFPAGVTNRDWKRPFVANEIGEVLPHWEAALYLATPTAMADTARGLRRTLSFTIAGAIALIAIGGWLVVHDVRRQLALAQQKTDFVSNVSHELKTPLTSIRMFAELMHDRPPPQEKQGQYLRIIQVEAERLTRLINNVLDFAKLERRQKRFDKKPLDLCCVITRVWEGHEMHLRDAGFTTRWQAAPGPYDVLGDEDALAQILVNLLSNAEKYSQDKKDIELVTWIEGGCINASILDRGIGVPDGEERKIFEAFYRAHDSLSSGIQGSGLGLTLAQRLAREHNGEITFDRRQGGGSRFNFRMPLVARDANHGANEEGISPA